MISLNGEPALVLGGGGSTGNAWLIGVVAELFEAGREVRKAALTIGIAAGSTAAEQLNGAAVEVKGRAGLDDEHGAVCAGRG